MNFCILLLLFNIRSIIGSCDKNLLKLEAPGFGYDIVKDTPRNNVFKSEYTYCKTEENNKYLIPDNYRYTRSGISHNTTDVYTSRNFTYYDGESSMYFSFQQSAETFPVEIAASENVKFKEYKALMINTEVTLIRLKYLYRIASLTITPNNKFADDFQKLVSDFVTAIKNNDYSKIQWHAYDIIQKYGTHVVESLTFGGSYVGIHFLKTEAVIATTYHSSYYELIGYLKILTKYGKFDGDLEISAKCIENRINLIEKATYRFERLIKGGDHSLADIDKWIRTVNDNRRVVEKRLQPIEDVIRPLLETNDQLYKLVKLYLVEAGNKYYSKNIIKGCTDVNAINYDKAATVNDGTCKSDPSKCCIESCPDDKKNKIVTEFNEVPCDSTRICPLSIEVWLMAFMFYKIINYFM